MANDQDNATSLRLRSESEAATAISHSVKESLRAPPKRW